MGNETFLFLCRLAWAACFRIPLIISVVCLIFDVHMQVEIEVELHALEPEAPRLIQNIPNEELLDTSFSSISELDMEEFEALNSLD